MGEGSTVKELYGEGTHWRGDIREKKMEKGELLIFTIPRLYVIEIPPPYAPLVVDSSPVPAPRSLPHRLEPVFIPYYGPPKRRWIEGEGKKKVQPRKHRKHAETPQASTPHTIRANQATLGWDIG
ncbi:hypothetical protein PUN28_020542 [Cardiocondyla obscurior]|uniref:Uncharacterized protein n=1 Tax=Cardiocondyla obscurior TaxID=286306 RepID=A0AAW2E4J9_9HYME